MIREKKYKASVTVEMSYIIPIILLVIVILIRVSFYFHDKIVLSGLVGETLVTGTQYVREQGRERVDLEMFFKNRMRNKLLILHVDEVDVLEKNKNIRLKVNAKKHKMQLHLEQNTNIIRPEEILRKKRKWEELSQKGK